MTTALLVLTVCFQAALGNVDSYYESSMPLVVMGHLMGGFATFCMLVVISALTISQAMKVSGKTRKSRN